MPSILKSFLDFYNIVNWCVENILLARKLFLLVSWNAIFKLFSAFGTRKLFKQFFVVFKHLTWMYNVVNSLYKICFKNAHIFSDIGMHIWEVQIDNLKLKSKISYILPERYSKKILWENVNYRECPKAISTSILS